MEAAQDEMAALRAEVEDLRAEVARLRSQQASHVCFTQPAHYFPQPLPGAAGGALPLTFPWPNNPCGQPLPPITVLFDTTCCAPLPSTFIVNV